MHNFTRYALPVLCLLAVITASSQSGRDDFSLTRAIQPITEDNFFKTSDYYNWCPSIIKGEDGQYHLFYSRWKKANSFYGWLPLSEVAHATAPSPAGPWAYKEIVLTGRGYGYWDAYGAHNPKIKYFNGMYYLYYISNHSDKDPLTTDSLVDIAHTGYPHRRWMEIRNNQRTGVAFSTSLDGPWTRLDHPIVEPAGPINTLTVNPAITQGPDGKYYMIIKGDKYPETARVRNQAIAVAETPVGPFTIQPGAVIDYLDTEDMSLWYDETRHRFYGIFHAPKGFLGLVTSSDGLQWEKAANYEICPKQLPMKDGTWFKPDRMERPFVYLENGIPAVLCVAVKQGNDSWNVFVPLKDQTKESH